MPQDALRELVKASNPVPNPAVLLREESEVRVLLEEVMRRADDPQASMYLLDDEVNWRSNMETKHEVIDVQPSPEQTERKLWPTAAMAAAAIAAIALLVFAVRPGDSPGDGVATNNERNSTTQVPAETRTPLEISDVINTAIVSGQLAEIRQLYSHDATYHDLKAAPLGSMFAPTFGPFPDWDGDELNTLFDEWLWDFANDYAAGVTRAYSCEPINPTTVTCEGIFENHAFMTDASDLTMTVILTVEDGVITHHQLDAGPINFSGVWQVKQPSELVVSYENWVKANRPDERRGLFLAGQMIMSPDTVETHRQFISEWRRQE